MRILVVIAHYFGPSHAENNLQTIGSYIEPLGRIAALNEAIVALHRNFGPHRNTVKGEQLPFDGEAKSRQLDIIIMTMRDRNVIGELGLAPDTFDVEYVDNKPPWIPFHGQRLLKERLGAYDFYCQMEDDLIIHDPSFFAKLAWFQQSFGFKALLAPVRFEMSSTGTPAKVIIDRTLPESRAVPFRRAGQREEIEGVWTGATRCSICRAIRTLLRSF